MVVRAEVEICDFLGILVCEWCALVDVLDWSHYEVRSDVVRHLTIITFVQFHICLPFIFLSHLERELSD